MINRYAAVQDSLAAAQDTLSTAYSQKWSGPTANNTLVEGFFTSAELWPVVFGVSIIIWGVLLWNLYSMERRLYRIEQKQEETAS
jgi:hypothetical protein